MLRQFAFYGICVATYVFGFAGAAFAQTLLTVENTTTGEIVEFTEEDLLAFEQHVVLTENEFVDGLAEFKGPLARDVVSSLESRPENYVLTAVNDYRVTIPAVDFWDYDVIFAMFQNEERFSARTKGPIWVIYPMTDNAELQDRTYNDRLIWQLIKVTME